MDDSKRAVSRRGFLVGTAGLWIHAAMPRPLAASQARVDRTPRVLDARQWRLVEAMTGRILPSDDTPGALEAGCVNFIDKALANEDAQALPSYRAALGELDRQSRERAGAGFAELMPDQQDEMLTRLETGRLPDWRVGQASPESFFETVRMHTILGFVLDPSYGGNRDYVGWKTMGFPGVVHHMGGSRPEQMLGEQRFLPIWERGPGTGHDES